MSNSPEWMRENIRLCEAAIKLETSIDFLYNLAPNVWDLPHMKDYMCTGPKAINYSVNEFSRKYGLEKKKSYMTKLVRFVINNMHYNKYILDKKCKMSANLRRVLDDIEIQHFERALWWSYALSTKYPSYLPEALRRDYETTTTEMVMKTKPYQYRIVEKHFVLCKYSYREYIKHVSFQLIAYWADARLRRRNLEPIRGKNLEYGVISSLPRVAIGELMKQLADYKTSVKTHNTNR